MATELIGDEEVRAFSRQGYLVPRGILSDDDELARIRKAVTGLFEDRRGLDGASIVDLGGATGSTREPRLPQVMSPEASVPWLARTQQAQRARRAAAALLGVDGRELAHFSHLISKPARRGAETPWHQDEAYWDPAFSYEGVSVWMPLDDVTVESGCLQFVPGSHLGDVRPHRHIHDDPAVHGLVTDEVDVVKAVPCPVSAGHVTIHHCRTLHYAGPNTTMTARRAYVHVFAVSTARGKPISRTWLDAARTVSPISVTEQQHGDLEGRS